ncbi:MULTISPECIES: hypothetical protein [Haloferax]|uniref:Uncharacterized protein n=2 Tax=Haloferax TaxID=2251 RepID=A0A6G1Z4F7_9EURY|nr:MULTISPECIES: hypothetical protein [Haloferax]KAB1188607.1 hypothetical protein Hfx1149_11395 [Haloferax sp. CBA1149]MRW81308.1 hypothetical protein [Haloferax marinisediminis]
MSNLLPEEAQQKLISTCRTAAGDSLRSLTYFNRFDYLQVYLRGDLEQEADLNSFIGNEWHDFKMTQDAYRGSELGDYQYTIRVFENGYLVRITVEDMGVFVTTDGITMQDFEALRTAVTAILDEWAVAE